MCTVRRRASLTRASTEAAWLARVRVRTLSFLKIEVTCVLTVPSAICSSRAMDLFFSPLASNASTSTSRAVKRASRSAVDGVSANALRVPDGWCESDGAMDMALFRYVHHTKTLGGDDVSMFASDCASGARALRLF